MTRFLLPAMLAGSMALGGVALAAPATATGTIKAIDHAAMTLTLNDGTVYILPTGFKDPGLKVGEKVSVTWDMQGSKHAASTVTVVQ